MEKCDIAIIGAGPYGLSAAAHAKALGSGVDVRVFGQTMSFWQCHMPKGMVLRSPRPASELADPQNRLTLGAFEKATGRTPRTPPPPVMTEPYVIEDYAKTIPLTHFIEYGRWFQKQAGIETDRRNVLRIERNGGFNLHLQDGQTLSAKRVVVAAGIQPFVHKPETFKDLPSSLVSHTSEHSDLEPFRGKEVFMVGAGQSALEGAALLHEIGAHVEVLARGPQIRWLRVENRWATNGPLSPLFIGKGDVGPPLLSQICQRPYLYRMLSRAKQDEWGARAVRAGGSNWVMSRMKPVSIHTGRFIERAEPQGDRVRVRLNDGTERVVDHIMLGTGYKVDISRYPFLDAAILDKIQRVNGYPCLADGLESASLPGLHFIGATAMWSFGPLMRFVAGVEFACRSLHKRMKAANGK